MKDSNFEHHYNLKVEYIMSLRLRHYFFVCCFMILPVFFLTSLMGAEMSLGQHDPNSSKESELNSVADSMDSDSNVRAQLLKMDIGVVEDRRDKATKDELRRIIAQIRSVTFEKKKQVAKPKPAVDQKTEPIVGPVIEPNETIADAPVTKERKRKEIVIRPPYEPVTGQTLQMLSKLSKQPEKIENPFELGETLFLSGNFKEAVVFYQEALNRANSGDAVSALDKSWILFQIGNCLREDDPPTAIKIYVQLMTEFPNSPWSNLAEARSKLLNLYQMEKIHDLIGEYKP